MVNEGIRRIGKTIQLVMVCFAIGLISYSVYEVYEMNQEDQHCMQKYKDTGNENSVVSAKTICAVDRDLHKNQKEYLMVMTVVYVGVDLALLIIGTWIVRGFLQGRRRSGNE